MRTREGMLELGCSHSIRVVEPEMERLPRGENGGIYGTIEQMTMANAIAMMTNAMMKPGEELEKAC